MKLNRNGFTLIELLAVITILGILMIVGIPAVQRTINNSRKDTFLDTAKEYANAVRTAWASDDISCAGGIKPSGASVDQNYIVWFSSVPDGVNKTFGESTVTTAAKRNFEKLIQNGGKSSWGNNDVLGFVIIKVLGGNSTEYYVYMVDEKGHGVVIEDTIVENLKRSNVVENAVLPDIQGATTCNVDNG